MNYKDLYPLLQTIPENRLPEVKVYLERIGRGKTNMNAYLEAAPYEDEEISTEENAAVREAEADIVANGTISHQELRKTLGL